MPYIIEDRLLKKVTGNDAQFTVPQGVIKIGKAAFRYCARLTQINIPEGVTKIGKLAFYKCVSLTQINIPEGVTEIGDEAFSGCRSLTQITIPEGVTKIGTLTFYKCVSLTQINIPLGVTKIGGVAFFGCTRLTQINIPKGVNIIGEQAFRKCTGLTQINIPQGVTEIGDGAFSGCTSLTQVNIPDSVTEMGEHVFKDCANLQRLWVSNNNEAARVKAFLPDELKDKVTSCYLQHQQNLNKIRRSQLALCSRSLNLFSSSLNNDVTGLIYQFLSFEDIITLSCICTGLKPIKVIAQSIQAVNYRGVIPRVKPASAVKTSFLKQYTPNENDKELTDYHRSLNQYKMNLKNSINQALNKSQSNNSNRENNNGGMLCNIL